MSLSLLDLSPSEAVAHAQEAAAEAGPEVLDVLDRFFRHGFLRFAQDRSAAPDELRAALLTACHWMEGERREPWRTRWAYLLELLQDAEEVPALAADVRALAGAEGRAAQILTVLVQEARPLRPRQLASRLGMSQQQVANVCHRLERAELIVRRHAEGRSTWIFPTGRGTRIAALLPAVATGQPEAPATTRRREAPAQRAPDLALWNPAACEPVPWIH